MAGNRVLEAWQRPTSDDPSPIPAHFPPILTSPNCCHQMAIAMLSNSALTARPYFHKTDYEKILKIKQQHHNHFWSSVSLKI